MMRWGEAIRNAFYSLLAHKLRSALTILGILIGVMTVAAMMSVTSGIDERIKKELESFSPRMFYIWKLPAMSLTMDWRKLEARPDITLEELDYLRRHSKSIEYITPGTGGMPAMGTVKYKNRETAPNVYIYGTDHTMILTYYWPLTSGRFFYESEVVTAKRVCVLGADVTEKLFPHESAVGKEVLVAGRRYTVIGTLEKRGEMFGTSMDAFVVIPITVYQKYYNLEEGLELYGNIKPNVPFEEGLNEIRMLLRQKRGLKAYEDDNFSIETRDTFMNAYKNITSATFAAAIGIAAISLIVGGIGVMNIMLVSVRERTREIGIRKSVGASRQDIFWQFLVESVVMSIVGGVLGLALAILGLDFAHSKLPSLPVKLFGWHLALAFGFSFITGIIFGIMPARRAAALNPIECLRYE